MRKLIALPLLAALTLVLGITAANAQSTDYKNVFEATLSGDEEVPEVETGATGEAAFGVSGDEREIDYVLNVFDGENITAAHLHCGSVGENGPVVVPLFQGEARDVDGTLASGTIRAADIEADLAECDEDLETMPHLIQAMREGNIYVNVHSTEHPAGLIRGQLMSVDGSSDLLNGDNGDNGDQDGDQDGNGDDQDGDDQNGDNNGDQNGSDGDQDGDQDGDNGDLPRVQNINLEFDEGIYTLTGTVVVASPCFVLGTDVNVSEGDPDTVFINLTTARSAQEICAQVLTERDFVRAFEADVDADITIALNDNPINFNGDDSGDQNGDNQNGNDQNGDNGDQNGDNGDGNTAVITIAKHICDASIQSIEAFDAVDRNGDGETTFIDKLLACPTVITPDDEYVPDAIHFPDRRFFDFEISSTTETQTIDDAEFMQSAIWEPNFEEDFNGDGDEIDGIGLSHYVYNNIANGYIVVDEIETPGNTFPAVVEFAPDEIVENDDMNALLADNLLEDGTIELDMSQDDDGEVMLHVFNFTAEGDDGINGDQDDGDNGDQDGDQDGNGDDQNGDDQNGDDNGNNGDNGDEMTEQELLQRLEDLFDELSVLLTDLFELN